MSSKLGKAGLAATSGLLVLGAVALAAHPRGGTFTSTKADVHVAAGGARIVDAQINCKQRGRGGLTIEAITFGNLNNPVSIDASGSFTYSGTAIYGYFTGSGYKSRMTTASLKGRFVSSKHVKGTVKGGPGACRSVRFAATYNPRAH